MSHTFEPEVVGAPTEAHPDDLVAPTRDDAGALATLDRVCFEDPWSVAAWRQELDGPDRCWRGIRDEDGLVASGGLWFAPDAAHVLRLAVAPHRRGRGLAGRLVDELIAVADRRGQRRLTLEVRASNHRASTLYRHRGFVPHGVRPGYYLDGEDAVILWRSGPADDAATSGR